MGRVWAVFCAEYQWLGIKFSFNFLIFIYFVPKSGRVFAGFVQNMEEKV
jgi:hypothetical protein